MNNLESTACPLCNSKNESFLFRKDAFNIVQCLECSLVFINPRLSEKATALAYNKNAISPLEYYQESLVGDRKAFKKRLKLIEKFVKNGKMLDVGCNVGTFLEVAKSNGWECFGIDVNKSVAAECKKRGIDFSATTLDKTKFKKEFFDVIILNDVIEHVHHPVKVMQQVYKLLKKGGFVFLVTPNIKSLTAKLLKKHWHHLKPDEHLMYFSPQTIQQLLDKTHFSPLFWKHVSRDRSIGIIVDKARSFFRGPALNKILPKKVQEVTIPLNTFDELCVIARKK